jgi:hypothetical protein
MCPTGWFVPTAEGPGYLDRVLRPVHATGELKHGDRCMTTEQLLAKRARDPRTSTCRSTRCSRA